MRRSPRRRAPRLTAPSAACRAPPDHSKVWLARAAVLTAAGGARGRRAAVNGLASTALTSAAVNLVLKPLGARRRPDRATHNIPVTRHVTMRRTTSFPSGHAASAFAFATGVAAATPEAGIPLSAAAALVAYSRVHTGVQLPDRRDRGIRCGRGAGAARCHRARAAPPALAGAKSSKTDDDRSPGYVRG
jgi:PAP2 superfamily